MDNLKEDIQEVEVEEIEESEETHDSERLKDMQSQNKFKELIKNTITFVGIIALALFIKAYVFSPVIVEGNSMYSTLHNNDIMILDRFSHRFDDYNRFDIIVVRVEGELLIKRIIALPTEKIQFYDNTLYINDQRMDQTFFDAERYQTDNFGPVVVPKGYYFVMGDNRPFSRDSRSFGVVSQEDLLGRANLVVYPFSHFGVVKH